MEHKTVSKFYRMMKHKFDQRLYNKQDKMVSKLYRKTDFYLDRIMEHNLYLRTYPELGYKMVLKLERRMDSEM